MRDDELLPTRRDMTDCALALRVMGEAGKTASRKAMWMTKQRARGASIVLGLILACVLGWAVPAQASVHAGPIGTGPAVFADHDDCESYLDADDVAAVNSATSQNTSDGSADVTTGDASAVGNDATTSAGQSAAGSGGGVSSTNQQVSVANNGTAAANTGGNTAVGNSSTNRAVTEQSNDDECDDFDDDGFLGSSNEGSGTTSGASLGGGANLGAADNSWIITFLRNFGLISNQGAGPSGLLAVGAVLGGMALVYATLWRLVRRRVATR